MGKRDNKHFTFHAVVQPFSRKAQILQTLLNYFATVSKTDAPRSVLGGGRAIVGCVAVDGTVEAVREVEVSRALCEAHGVKKFVVRHRYSIVERRATERRG